MKDLKYLYEFENLLQEANNELVQQAKKDGKLCLAYTCYHIPEVLLNLPGCFSTRLRAPRTGSLDISTYYLSSFLCGFSKALVEKLKPSNEQCNELESLDISMYYKYEELSKNFINEINNDVNLSLEFWKVFQAPYKELYKKIDFNKVFT